MVAKNEQTQEVSVHLPPFPENSAGFISKCFSALVITRKLLTTTSPAGGREGLYLALMLLSSSFSDGPQVITSAHSKKHLTSQRPVLASVNFVASKIPLNTSTTGRVQIVIWKNLDYWIFTSSILTITFPGLKQYREMQKESLFYAS